ncbi:MAG: rod shape-determining protein MreD [Acidimicrobiales bacterium]|jgi:rod shape-determining protein MreD
MTTTVRTGVVLVTALLLQVAVVPWLTIAGVQVDLLLLVTLAAGLSGGPERGARVGFVAGILWDLVVVGPFGLSALTYCLAGYFVGSAQRSVVGPTWWAPIPGAALAGAASVFFYATVGAVFGYEEWLDGQTLVIAGVVALSAAVLVLPAIRILAWTEGEPLGLRFPSRPHRRGSFAPGRGRRRSLTTGFRR